MKKIIVLFICLSFIGGSAVTNSCTKDSTKVKGCTDKNSKNYNASAEVDDGSCLYAGKVVLWFNQTTSTFLTNDGATALTYYLNGAVVGSSAANVYWTAAPTCDQSGSVTITKDLGNVKTQAYTLSVKDQTGFEYWTSVLNFNANTCTALELTSGKKK